MKKLIIFLLCITSCLYARPKAVVFDFGDVLAHPNREVVIAFLCDTFELSKEEFATANQRKKTAVKEGKTDTQFWQQFAKEKGVELAGDWSKKYDSVLKEAIGINPKMFGMIEQLKENQLQVGLLSNIDEEPAIMIRNFGLYLPFDPCILSYEVGYEKPDPKIYQILIEKSGIKPDDLVFIDDLHENVEAAKNAGIDAIVFESYEQIQKELLKRGLL